MSTESYVCICRWEAPASGSRRDVHRDHHIEVLPVRITVEDYRYGIPTIQPVRVDICSRVILRQHEDTNEPRHLSRCGDRWLRCGCGFVSGTETKNDAVSLIASGKNLAQQAADHRFKLAVDVRTSDSKLKIYFHVVHKVAT